MKTYLKHYWKYARQGSTGLAIAPFSSQLWGSFIDSLVDVVMTLITFAFLLACWCVYPLAVLLFALAACEGERRSVKRSKAFWREVQRGDCLDWERADRCEKGSPQGLSGWYCSRDKGHDGPCALHKVDE
jgi:hypothetical protein